MVVIEASILAADCAHLGEQARAAQSAGADAIQVDVMDGRFVPAPRSLLGRAWCGRFGLWWT